LGGGGGGVYDNGELLLQMTTIMTSSSLGTLSAEQSAYRVPPQNVVLGNEPFKYARHVKTYAKQDYVIT